MAQKNLIIEKWTCTACDYIYDSRVGDPGKGIMPETPFRDLSEMWFCPESAARKDQFVPYSKHEKKNYL